MPILACSRRAARGSGLDRHVQRGSRLVAAFNSRPAGQRHRDHGPVVAGAPESMCGIRARRRLRARGCRAREQLDRAAHAPRPLRAPALRGAPALADLVADGLESGIQRRSSCSWKSLRCPRAQAAHFRARTSSAAPHPSKRIARWSWLRRRAQHRQRGDDLPGADGRPARTSRTAQMQTTTSFRPCSRRAHGQVLDSRSGRAAVPSLMICAVEGVAQGVADEGQRRRVRPAR